MKIDQSKGLLFPCLWNILKAAFLMDDNQSCYLGFMNEVIKY